MRSRLVLSLALLCLATIAHAEQSSVDNLRQVVFAQMDLVRQAANEFTTSVNVISDTVTVSGPVPEFVTIVWFALNRLLATSYIAFSDGIKKSCHLLNEATDRDDRLSAQFRASFGREFNEIIVHRSNPRLRAIVREGTDEAIRLHIQASHDGDEAGQIQAKFVEVIDRLVGSIHAEFDDRQRRFRRFVDSELRGDGYNALLH